MPPAYSCWDDPTQDPSGLTLTGFHLFVFASGALSLAVSNANLPPDMVVMAGMWRRINALLVLALFAHQALLWAMKNYHDQMSKPGELREIDERLNRLGKVEKKPTDWEKESGHPSHFLTTRDAKPRLFPFPLGKAGGQATKGELWWEAGNSAHVGHFNPKEDPEEKEKLRLAMVAREKERRAKAKASIQEYTDIRLKWHRRLTHVKTIGAIIAVGMWESVHRTVATGCLIAYLYYVLATELVKLLKPEEEEDEYQPLRKPISLTPGMGMTYIYEPSEGGVQATGAMPVTAPAHRLTTSLDSRYAT